MWLLLAACQPQPDVLVVEGDPVPKQTRPLVGGRAGTDPNWSTVVASDEDGDRIILRDMDASPPDYPEPRFTEIQLPSGWAPGEVSMVSGAAAIVAQGAGQVVFVRLAPFQIDGVVPVCSDPRGLSYVPDSTYNAWVACGDGSLVQVDWQGPTGQRWFVAPTDLTHVYVHGAGDAFVATSGGGEVLRVDLTTGDIVARTPLPTAEGADPSAPHVVHRIVHGGDDATYVLHESDSQSLLTRIGWWEDVVTTAVVDATGALDVAAWAEGDIGFRIPTPIVAAADIGGGPGVKSLDPLGVPDDSREVHDRPSFLLTDAPVVGVAAAAGGPVAVTRDPFSVVWALEGVLVPSDR